MARTHPHSCACRHCLRDTQSAPLCRHCESAYPAPGEDCCDSCLDAMEEDEHDARRAERRREQAEMAWDESRGH